MPKPNPKSGEQVQLVALPNWLIDDLPVSEQDEMLSYVGQNTTITEIDAYGYIWIEFGNTFEDDDSAHYKGHKFCVTPDCLEWL